MIKSINSISAYSKFRDETLQDRRMLHKFISDHESKSDHIEAKLGRLEDLHQQIAEKIDRMNSPQGEMSRGSDEEFHFDSANAVSRIVLNPSEYSGDLAKKILRLLSPKDVVDMSFVRVGNERDGGYVMLDRDLQNSVAYSFGISEDVSWDQGMVDRGCQIYQFDHTINGLPYENPNFHWKKLGIAANTGGEFISVTDIIKENGHQNNNDLILKMDIEGAEWDVFESIDSDHLSKFKQIVVELHSFVTGRTSHLERVVPVLEKLNRTHQSVHIHANNYGWLGIIGGVMLPDVFELTYVRRSDHQFVPCTREFPTPLDRACRADAPDYFLRV
jgi:hypothetical protein